jgi:hypothetical protein
MTVVKLIEVGDEVGVILPDEVLARLKVGLGDTVYLSEAHGSLMLKTQVVEDGGPIEAAQ